MKNFWRISIYLCVIFFSCQIGLIQAEVTFQNEKGNYFVFSPDGEYLAKVFYSKGKTKVRIHETDEMQVVVQWQIPNFMPHTIQFSTQDSKKLLLAGSDKLMVYQLRNSRQQLVFSQSSMPNQKITQASFDIQTDEIIWATNDTLYKASLTKKQEQKIAAIEEENSSIRSLTTLPNNTLAVSVKGSNDVYLYSPQKNQPPEILSEHNAPVAGIQSPEGTFLFSIDDQHQLLIWDLENNQVVKRIQLTRPENVSPITGVALDASRKNLLVYSQNDPKGVGKKYLISDLRNGIVNPQNQALSISPAGNIYSTSHTFSKTAADLKSKGLKRSQMVRPWAKSQKKKKENSLYDLAKIEADNDNYKAALDLIKQIPLEDPEFKQSRELKRKIFDQIDMNNSFDAAMDQYQRGNYDSAKILLEKIQVKHPKNPAVKRYLSLTESKLSRYTVVFFLIILIVVLLLILLGYLLWKYQDQVKSKLKTVTSDKKDSQNGKLSSRRKEFILLLEATKVMLKTALSKDRQVKHKEKWLEFRAKLNLIEKRAKLEDKSLPMLIDQLSKLQKSIQKLSPENKQEKKKTSTSGNSSKKQKTTASDSSSKKQNRQSTDQQSSGKKSSSEDKDQKKKSQNYYQVLDVKESATNDDIKKAYRKKMREYHPDRHNASDFEWIKEEADRMTKRIQEAYSVLSDPEKRKRYTEENNRERK